jgi:ubiquinone/menaquinone biosynthesis C-methylase UbiE
MPDDVYLNEDRRNEPKEMFVFVANEMEQIIQSKPAKTLIDIGCGPGEFLYYVNKRFPELKLTGLDVTDSYIKKATSHRINADFKVGSIDDRKSLPKGPFDLVTMIGVHSYFDDPEEWVPNLLGLGSKNSTYLVIGCLNPHPVDVAVRYKRSEESVFRKGLSIISKETMRRAFEIKGRSVVFKEFNISIELPYRKEDCLRAWTLKNFGDRYIQTNGLCELIYFFLMVVQ